MWSSGSQSRTWQANLVASRSVEKQEVGGGLGHLDRHVAEETVGYDNISLALEYFLGLDVADEVEAGAIAAQARVDLARELVAFTVLLAVGEQSYPRLRALHELTRVDAAHVGELHQELGPGI